MRFLPTPSPFDANACERALMSLCAAREDEQVTAHAIALSKPYACAGCSLESAGLENRAQSSSHPLIGSNDLGFVSSAQQQIFSEHVGFASCLFSDK